ncbi:hypothetical protein [Sorangium sp. So ce131]|uniref:hypothetical protein n=1 Tax=Sorangium sp. So ce131 TaxID=3133282 RepID=UPI003F5FC471
MSMEAVAACFDGTAATRGEAISKLTAGQLDTLFPEHCVCGSNHKVGADNLARAWKALLPNARLAAMHLGARQFIALGAVRGELAQVLEAARLSGGGSTRRRRRRGGSDSAVPAQSELAAISVVAAAPPRPLLQQATAAA